MSSGPTGPIDLQNYPSLADLAAAVSGKDGLTCRRCGCREFRVYYTRPKEGAIMRRRICRHCGLPITTYERQTG